VGRSTDGRQCWLDWIVRRRTDGRAVGTMQATVGGDEGDTTAEVAWLVGRPHQGRGYAREAAQCMVEWLRGHGVVLIRAHVHPDHAASQGVARAIGLGPTRTMVDGEVRWESPPDRDP
jgi:RimJ/RimL family protein N-acetyltransferase